MLDLRIQFDPVDLHACGKSSLAAASDPLVQRMHSIVELVCSKDCLLIIRDLDHAHTTTEDQAHTRCVAQSRPRSQEEARLIASSWSAEQLAAVQKEAAAERRCLLLLDYSANSYTLPTVV